MKYKCEKHGFLDIKQRLIFQGDTSRRWCFECYKDMMDQFCKVVEVIEDEKPDTSYKKGDGIKSAIETLKRRYEELLELSKKWGD